MKKTVFTFILAGFLISLFVNPAYARENSAYIVQPGDTMLSIARKHGISVSQLARANGIPWYAWVYTGQSLVIPGQGNSTTPQPTGNTNSGTTTYTVRRGDTLLRIARRYGISVSELAQANNMPWYSWVYVGQQLAIPGQGSSSTPQPTGNTIGERWIDVNLSTQSLTAYEGDTAVYNAIVSTGLPATPTPVGTYRIWVKLRYDDMAGPGYYLPDVPYTMYFYQGYGLHGTYWHDNFGTPMSHGCVNLSNTDAAWLYSWASVGTKVVIHY